MNTLKFYRTIKLKLNKALFPTIQLGLQLSLTFYK